MLSWRETSRFCSLVQCLVKRALGASVEFKVDDVATFGTNQMVVMMMRKRLSEFVASEVIAGDDTGYGADLLENGEVAIHARLGQ